LFTEGDAGAVGIELGEEFDDAIMRDFKASGTQIVQPAGEFQIFEAIDESDDQPTQKFTVSPGVPLHATEVFVGELEVANFAAQMLDSSEPEKLSPVQAVPLIMGSFSDIIAIIMALIPFMDISFSSTSRLQADWFLPRIPRHTPPRSVSGRLYQPLIGTAEITHHSK